MPHSSLRFLFPCLLALALLPAPPRAAAQQTWQAQVGAESPDMGTQALAFLPNEIWIHAGDSIRWTWGSDEIHTLSFLTLGQLVPSFQTGCPGFATPPASFDGSTCLSTPPMVKGQTFTVKFPTAGSFKFLCLVHITMTGTVHVLNPWVPLPHDQKFYNEEAQSQRQKLLSDVDSGAAHHPADDDDDATWGGMRVLPHRVMAGIGEISANPGGTQTASLVRFVHGDLTIHAGDTVEWGNFDPIEPHTITFGFNNGDPADTFDPTSNVTIDADGALHATINSPSDQVSSGFIEQPLEDEPGFRQNPIVNAQNPATNIGNVALSNPTRFRVTFTHPGVYPYHCVLHDNLGMVGKIIVVP